MSKTTLEQRRDEALKRLDFLKKHGMTYGAAVRAFRDKGDIGIFENQGGFANAVYYEMRLNSGDNDFYDELCTQVDCFESENDATVYLILVNHTMFGELVSFLYVSDQPQEWEDDMDDLKNQMALVYVYNRDDDMLSEFGSISFAYSPAFGGIYRVS